MNKHAPMPWTWQYSNDTGPDDDYFVEFFCIYDANGNEVGRAEEQVDAMLMSSAPDLLQALKDMCKGFRHLEDSDFPALARARSVMAKATGEQH